MGRKRIAGIQTTPRLVPVSYAAAELGGSGDPAPVVLRVGGELVFTETGSHINVTSEEAAKLRPPYTLLFMAATTPEGAALRKRDIRLLSSATEQTSSVYSPEVVLRYLKQERPYYLVAMALGDGGVLYLSPSFATENSLSTLSGPYVVGRVFPNTSFWALGLPVVLELDDLPSEMPKEATWVDLLSDFPWVGNRPDSQPSKRALPVVDPLLLLRSAAQIYGQACDRYLLHMGEFVAEGATEPSGSHLYLKKCVAELLIGLPSQALGDSAAKLAVANARRFMRRYMGEARDSDIPGNEGVRQLVAARELAALNLITWLESESLELIWKLYRNKNGTCDDPAKEAGYLTYVEARLLALSRLSESERGKHYLMQQVDGADSKDPSGLSFVLPPESPGPHAPTAKWVVKLTKGIVGLWIKLLPLIVERVAKGVASYKVSGETFERVGPTVKKLAKQLEKTLGQALFDIDILPPSRIQVMVDGALRDIEVHSVELRLRPDGVDDASKKLGDALTLLRGSLEAINAGIAFSACWEAVRDGKYDLKSLGSGLTLLKSLNFFAQEGAKRLGKRALDGGLKTSMEKLGSRLSVVGTVLDIAASGVSVLELYEKGDYDAAALEFIGARIGIWALSVSGPAGWALLALSLGFAVSVDWFKDTPYDKLAKFSVFGDGGVRRKSALDKSDQAWTMATSYREWDYKEKAGFDLWTQAASQLAFAFSVRGFEPQQVDPTVACVQIEAQQLLASTRLHLHVAVTYSNPGASVMATKKYDADLWVVSLLDGPVLFDYSGQLQMNNAVRVRDGRIVELTLQRLAPFMYSSRHDGKLHPMVVHDFTCTVRLDAFGDGKPTLRGEDASLVVPTTHEGKRWVKAEVLQGGAMPSEVAKSYDIKFLLEG